MMTAQSELQEVEKVVCAFEPVFFKNGLKQCVDFNSYIVTRISNGEVLVNQSLWGDSVGAAIADICRAYITIWREIA